MDNGDNRILANGSTCGATDNPCCTTVPVFAIDELAKTAIISFRRTIASSKYSEWGGDASVLANGNLEYDLCASPTEISTEVDEITMGSSPQVVWSMSEAHENFYRANRLPSLYPGVQ